jgi:hypothetical protein
MLGGCDILSASALVNYWKSINIFHERCEIVLADSKEINHKFSSKHLFILQEREIIIHLPYFIVESTKLLTPIKDINNQVDNYKFIFAHPNEQSLSPKGYYSL